MSSSCQTLLAALKDCILHSDCVRNDNRLPSDCLRNHASDLPEECQSLRKATFECKRGMVRIAQSELLRNLDMCAVGYEKAFQGEYGRC